MNFLKSITAFIIIVGAVGLLVIVFDWSENRSMTDDKYPWPTETTINSFADCLAADYSVMESYPRQCQTPDGRRFTEDIGNELDLFDFIHLNQPRPNQTVNSPIVINGQARGPWFFEAGFLVELTDETGQILAQGSAEALTDWMTEDFVPFELTLEFDLIKPTTGRLILHRANPSGQPNRDISLNLPLELQPTAIGRPSTETQTD